MTTPTNRQAEHERLRLIDAIWTRTEREVNAVIPPTISKDTRTAILEELLPNTRFVLSSLSIEQLRDEVAIEDHVTNTVSTAQFFVGRILKRDLAINLTESMCADCDGSGSFDFIRRPAVPTLWWDRNHRNLIFTGEKVRPNRITAVLVFQKVVNVRRDGLPLEFPGC